MNNELLVNTIKMYCKNKGITVTKLEETLNMSQGLIGRWLKSSPSLDKVIDIADFFDTSVDSLIGRKDEREKNEKLIFCKKIYELTTSQELLWENETDNLESKEKEYPDALEVSVLYYNELYIAKYKQGYIWLFTQYEKDKNVITKMYSDVFIQPDEKSRPVVQNGYNDMFNKLWYYLHTQYYGVPDEFKAKQLKDDLIHELSFDDLNQSQQKQIVDNIIKINPQMKKAFDLVNTKEFQHINEMLSKPEMKSAIELTQKLSKLYKR